MTDVGISSVSSGSNSMSPTRRDDSFDLGARGLQSNLPKGRGYTTNVLKDGGPPSHDNLDFDRTCHNLLIHMHAAYRVLPPHICLNSHNRRVSDMWGLLTR